MLLIQCIDFNSAKRPMGYEGQMMRIAYLYADKIIASGSNCFTIDFDRIYGPDRPAHRKKLMIEKFAKYLTPPRDKEAARIYAGQKEMQSIKHKHKETIVMLKRGEKILDDIYLKCVIYLRSRFINSGLFELSKLEDDELEYRPGNRPDPELKQPEPHHWKGSDVLREKWSGKDEVYALNEPFWQYLQENNLSIAAGEETEQIADVITFQLPFLSILNHLTATELTLLKRDLLPEPEKLRSAVSQWSEELKSTDFSASRFSSYTTYFRNEIAPHLEEMEQRIKANEMHRRVDDLYRGKAGSKVYLAIAKAKTVWDYLEWNKSMPGESIHAFMLDLPAGCDENKAVLLLLCNSFNLHREQTEVSDKKSLQL